jgi:hypothetical protein
MSESPRSTVSVANPKRTRIDSLDQITSVETDAERPVTTPVA